MVLSPKPSWPSADHRLARQGGATFRRRRDCNVAAVRNTLRRHRAPATRVAQLLHRQFLAMTDRAVILVLPLRLFGRRSIPRLAPSPGDRHGHGEPETH